MRNIYDECHNVLINNVDQIDKLYETVLKKSRENIELIDSTYNMEVSGDAPCQICKVGRINIFLEPCGHCVCFNCKEKIIETNNCPFCRTNLLSYKKLYLGF